MDFLLYSLFCAGLVNLTQIPSTAKVALEGNVHTGASPPWLDATKGDQLNPARRPEMKETVSSRAGKSKLNPKRVGAAWAERRKLELEMERRGERVNNNFDANWLPNFGRVWQSGTRKKSRKEFQMENKATQEADNQSEALIPVQPYISKRMLLSRHEIFALSVCAFCHSIPYSEKFALLSYELVSTADSLVKVGARIHANDTPDGQGREAISQEIDLFLSLSGWVNISLVEICHYYVIAIEISVKF
ncbi:hypothetical protein C2S51_038241 [Perilla frutescens var. frutescens]|nr:hypothetical protein C2S51_038241 [Perilla frutescens var. frutescens]